MSQVQNGFSTYRDSKDLYKDGTERKPPQPTPVLLLDQE